MKEKNKFLIIVVLIILYFVSTFINSHNSCNYILYSDSLYRIRKNNLTIANPLKIKNKKLNLVNKKFVVENGYYKEDRSGNNSFIFYDKKNNNLRKEKYYYGSTKKMNIVKFTENSGLNDKDIKKINELLSDFSISINISKLNYYKIVSFDDKKLIFIGNFYDDNNFGKSPSDLKDDRYYEFIIYKDKDSYNIVKKIDVSKDDFFETDFLLFDCVLKTDDYYVGIGQINYSFFDGSSRNLYKLSNKKLTLVK